MKIVRRIIFILTVLTITASMCVSVCAFDLRVQNGDELFVIDADDQDNIRNLKDKITDFYGTSRNVPFYRQKLSLGSRALNNDTSIYDYDISEDSILQLEVIPEPYWTYTTIDESTARLDKYVLPELEKGIEYPIEEELVVPSVIDGYTVTELGDGALKDCKVFGKVSLPSTLTKIGDEVFYNSLISEIDIPASVTSIGKRAFIYCSGLRNVEIKSAVTYIGDNAFEGCYGLTGFTSSSENYPVRDGIVYNSDYSTLIFYPIAASASSFTCPAGVTKIENHAFRYSINLTEVTLGNDLVSIGEQAFSGATLLRDLTIGNNVAEIKDFAFSGCSRIFNLNLGTSVKELGGQAFYGCSALTNISGGDSLERIGKNCFTFCTKITGFPMPESLSSIESFAFYGCSSLKSVSLPERITEITPYSFAYCTALNSFTMTDNVKTICRNAFMNCFYIASLEVPDAIEFIGYEAFDGCVSLTVSTVSNGICETYCKKNGVSYIITHEGAEPYFENVYTDISEGDWFYNPIKWAVINGIFAGTTQTTMTPNGSTTRAMVAVMLARYSWADLSDYRRTPFTDVLISSYYEPSVAWAYRNELVTGVGDKMFAPDNNISREQLAMILFNYYIKIDGGAYASNPDADPFAGFGQSEMISSWARTAMAWAVENQLISGDESRNLNPTGFATRAEVAKILQNYDTFMKGQ